MRNDPVAALQQVSAKAVMTGLGATQALPIINSPTDHPTAPEHDHHVPHALRACRAIMPIEAVWKQPDFG